MPGATVCSDVQEIGQEVCPVQRYGRMVSTTRGGSMPGGTVLPPGGGPVGEYARWNGSVGAAPGDGDREPGGVAGMGRPGAALSMSGLTVAVRDCG